MRVLIVEQEDVLRQSLGVFMEKFQRHEVFMARSEKEGLSLCQEDTFDLALCGEPLADGDSISLLAAMKDRNPEIITVLMTVRNDEALAEKAILSGVNGYLVKPFDLRQLEAIICENNLKGAHPGSLKPKKTGGTGK
ncbi:MAG: response regulator [Smithellaceae bacterium]|nr:response regulator [Smithellaceae bacterium]